MIQAIPALTVRVRASLLLCALIVVACGKKGPPLPPLVRIPAAPTDFKADRRALAVEVQFVVPAANTDGSRPANIQRVEVFALNGLALATATEVLAKGVLVGAADVKAPVDPNDTIEADDPDSDAETLVGPGLDQGATARVRELLSAATSSDGATTRTYVGVTITTRGRRGTTSVPVAVSLGPAPAAPSAPSVAYDEAAVTVTWAAVSSGDAGSVRYHVYDASPPDPAARASIAAAGAPAELRLSDAPLPDLRHADTRMTWNAERCYRVRALQQYGELAVEGDASPPTCVTLKDTFAPGAPTGVTAVASEGAINLIWSPSPERDLAGYRVLRAPLPSGATVAATPATIPESSYTDTVPAGVRYAYSVQAVDTAGNVSTPSAAVEETAR